MKNIILPIVLISITISCYSQQPRNEFNYAENTDFDEQVVFRNTSAPSVNRYEKIVINGIDSKVPFYHYISKDNKSKFVFLLHGIGGTKDDWLRPQSEKKLLVDSLVTLGYDVIIPDAKFHGERSYEFNFRPAWTLPRGIRNGKSQEDAKSIHQVYAITIKDIKILMDFFENKYKEQDLQFDFIGESMGGAISLLLNATEKRVNNVVACVPPVTRPFEELKDYDWPTEITNLMKDITPLFYVESQHAPTLLLMGRTDPFTSENQATEFYKKIPVQEKKIKFYEAGHTLPPEYINDAIEWITTHNKH